MKRYSYIIANGHWSMVNGRDQFQISNTNIFWKCSLVNDLLTHWCAILNVAFTHSYGFDSVSKHFQKIVSPNQMPNIWTMFYYYLGNALYKILFIEKKSLLYEFVQKCQMSIRTMKKVYIFFALIIDHCALKCVGKLNLGLHFEYCHQQQKWFSLFIVHFLFLLLKMKRELFINDLHKKVSYYSYENFVHVSQNRFIAFDKTNKREKKKNAMKL